MTPRPITRRRALVLGGMGVAALAAGTVGWVATAGSSPDTPAGGGSSDPGASGENTDGTVTTTGPVERMRGRGGALVLVNGQYQPAVPATPGRAQRWRLVNGCTSRVLAVRHDAF